MEPRYNIGMKDTLKIRKLFKKLAGPKRSVMVWYWNDKRADGTRRKIFKVYGPRSDYNGHLDIWTEVQKSFPDWELYSSYSTMGARVTGLYKREAI